MKKLLLYLFTLLLFCGCESSGDSESTKAVTIPTEFSTIHLDSGDQSKTITFTAITDWIISLDESTKAIPSWVTVSPMSGGAGNISLLIVLEENTADESRSAEIVISAGDFEQSLSVTQAAFTPVITLNKSSVSVGADSGSFELNVTSNIDWTTSGVPDWITLSSSSGTGDKIVTVSYSANTITSREATIEFIGSSISCYITITQAAFGLTFNGQLEDLDQEEL